MRAGEALWSLCIYSHSHEPWLLVNAFFLFIVYSDWLHKSQFLPHNSVVSQGYILQNKLKKVKVKVTYLTWIVRNSPPGMDGTTFVVQRTNHSATEPAAF